MDWIKYEKEYNQYLKENPDTAITLWEFIMNSEK